MKNKLFSREEILDQIHDGQRIIYSDVHGGMSADEIIDGMLERGIKDLTLIGITSGRDNMGMGRLIAEHRVKKIITTHIGLNKAAIEQMFAGELEVEFVPQGTFAERIRCGGFGLGGCLTRTGLGTQVQEGKEIINVDGKDYLLERPIRADVALLQATKADRAGNLYCRGTSHLCVDYIAMAADLVVAEVPELVEIGELDPEKVIVQAPIVDMVYVRQGEKRPLWPAWEAQINKIKAKEAAKEAAK